MGGWKHARYLCVCDILTCENLLDVFLFEPLFRCSLFVLWGFHVSGFPWHQKKCMAKIYIILCKKNIFLLTPYLYYLLVLSPSVMSIMTLKEWNVHVSILLMFILLFLFVARMSEPPWFLILGFVYIWRSCCCVIHLFLSVSIAHEPSRAIFVSNNIIVFINKNRLEISSLNLG